MQNQKQQVRHLSNNVAAVIEVKAASSNSAVALQKRKDEANKVFYIDRI